MTDEKSKILSGLIRDDVIVYCKAEVSYTSVYLSNNKRIVLCSNLKKYWMNYRIQYFLDAIIHMWLI